MDKAARNAPCVFNVYARTDSQIAMKAKFKADLAGGFTLVPHSVWELPPIMKDYSLETAVYRDGCRRADHLKKIVCVSIDVDPWQWEMHCFYQSRGELFMCLMKKRFALL